MSYGDDVQIREVAGGRIGWNSGGTDATLTELEARLDRIHESFAYLEGAEVRIREAQAADAQARERCYRDLLHARGQGPASPEVGKALEEAIFGQSAPVRESVHTLGKVMSGPHSHGSVRHTHDRLPGDHLHCMHCGGDSRLCLDNPHHAEGAVPAREANSNPWIEGVERMFDGEPSRPVRYEDILALEQSWQQSRAAADAKRPARQATEAARRFVAGFEHAIDHGGLRQ
jgi:hypothetical protein